MGTINKHKYERLMNKQDSRCYYCLQPFYNNRNKINCLKKATIDHIKPVCEMKGMTMLEKNTMNTVIACLDCNRRKANISADLFLDGYEAINISPYDEPSEFIAIKTRSKRRWYHKYIKW